MKGCINVFVITTKVSKTKLAAVVTLLIAVFVLGVILAAAKTGTPEAADARNGESNEARVAYVTQQGWQVNAEPVQTQSVKIPTADTEVFRRYNELQKTQGFDLTQYAGRQATRYVYEVLNAEDAEGPVYATIFVLDGRIVGGDVTDTAPGGKMRGVVKS